MRQCLIFTKFDAAINYLMKSHAKQIKRRKNSIPNTLSKTQRCFLINTKKIINIVQNNPTFSRVDFGIINE